MNCWNCKYYDYEDYRIAPDGTERPYGRCFNPKSEEYKNKVDEDDSCEHWKLNKIIK
jgi:hypothetical protein